LWRAAIGGDFVINLTQFNYIHLAVPVEHACGEQRLVEILLLIEFNLN
jgi:hypothetical protein